MNVYFFVCWIQSSSGFTSSINALSFCLVNLKPKILNDIFFVFATFVITYDFDSINICVCMWILASLLLWLKYVLCPFDYDVDDDMIIMCVPFMIFFLWFLWIFKRFCCYWIFLFWRWWLKSQLRLSYFLMGNLIYYDYNESFVFQIIMKFFE